MSHHAIVRIPGPGCHLGITAAGLGEACPHTIIRQHAAYCDLLRSLGVELTVLPPLTSFPDAYFVEDSAVIFPEIAVITRPGAMARRGETDSIAQAILRFRPVATIAEPGTLDGGDVLVAGKQVMIGLSGRTNAHGAKQLGTICERFGYSWTTVIVDEGLHLKSKVSEVGGNTLLVSRGFSCRPEFRSYHLIPVDEAEDYAANTVMFDRTIIMAAGFPSTRRALERLNRPIIELDVSEIRKMDGGLSCMSLRFATEN